MRWIWSLIAASALCHAAASAQAVPEGKHNDVNGPSTICGISGNNALEIREKLKSDPDIAEEPSGSERFETYYSISETKGWTVTTEKETAYPAVTCLDFYASGGSTYMRRELRCDASREACDALFLEFKANDEKIRRQTKGG